MQGEGCGVRFACFSRAGEEVEGEEFHCVGEWIWEKAIGGKASKIRERILVAVVCNGVVVVAADEAWFVSRRELFFG